MRPDVAGARGGARYGLSWTARACADIATIAALGRPLPIARRHPAERVPLTQRVHHRSGD
jgi:hypothetical protein